MSAPYRILLDDLGVATLPERPPQQLLDELVNHWLASAAVKEAAAKEAAAGPQILEVENSALPAQVAASVALVCDASSVEPAANGRSTLKTVPMGVRTGGVVVDQPAVPDAQSGFLVGDDLLLTTLHDLDADDVAGEFKVVFDFKLVGGTAATTIDNRRVFDVVDAVSFGAHYGKEFFDDWLLLRLAGPTGRASGLGLAGALPKLSPPPPVPPGLFMIGHPHGLPMKVFGQGKVTGVHTFHFECDLPARPGNSGSMVANDTVSSIVGVLQDAHCFGGNGCITDVTSSTAFKAKVEKATAAPHAFAAFDRLIRWISRKPHGPVPAARRPARRSRHM